MVRFSSDYNQVATLQELTGRDRRDGSLQAFLTIAQTLALYGVNNVLDAINDLRNSKSKFDDEVGLAQSQLMSKHTQVARDMGYTTQIPQAINHQETRSADYEDFGLNFLNRFGVFFLENNQLNDDDAFFLHQMCTEVQLEGFEIATATNDIVFSTEEDVSDVKLPQVQFTFLVDRDLKIKRILERVINKMRNFKTGRYGYKDDYKWNQVDLLVMNNFNMVTNIYRMKDVIISGIDGLSLTSGTSEVQTTQVTMKFSDFEIL